MRYKILRSNALTCVGNVVIPKSIRRIENGWTVMAQSNNKKVIDKIWADLYPKYNYRLLDEGKETV